MSRIPTARLMLNTATVVVPSISQETGTGAMKIADGASSSYSCSIQPVSASEVASMGRDYSEGVVRGYFPIGASIPPHSKVTSSSNAGNTITYRTIGIARNGAGVNTYVEVLMVTESIVNV